MNESSTERPTPLIFDFDQWRRDIETFAEETQFELQQIIADLTGNDPNSSHRMKFQDPLPDKKRSSGESKSPHNHRLASLKEKLIERITHPNK